VRFRSESGGGEEIRSGGDPVCRLCEDESVSIMNNE